MYDFIKLKDEDRRVIFENTASKMKMNSAIVEKDFWVCFVIDYLFNNCKFKNSFAFKGGTCLSKVYKLIDRFSEDIDLILDWRLLGYSDNELWGNRSKTQQDKIIKEAKNKQDEFLENELLPVLKKDLGNIIGGEKNIVYDKDAIKINYPRTLNEKGILQEIRLEIGALAAWTPVEKVFIEPYISECYPGLLKYNSISLFATTAIRSFWEKATILHHEANRPKDSKLPLRYSRHYYDLYCMSKKGILDDALKNEDLLLKVVEFKKKFYPRNWAEYDKARIGTLKLRPSSFFVEDLKKDYIDMKSMIYGEYPDFDTLMEEIDNIESILNKRG